MCSLKPLIHFYGRIEGGRGAALPSQKPFFHTFHEVYNTHSSIYRVEMGKGHSVFSYFRPMSQPTNLKKNY